MVNSSRLALVASILSVGFAIGLSLGPKSARALSCESHHSEELDLALVAVEIDGQDLGLDAVEVVPGTWMTVLFPAPGGSDFPEAVYVRDAPDYDRWAVLDLDTPIEPSAEVTDYIATSEARKTKRGLCGGLPFVPAKPGVYVIDPASEPGLPMDATLTLDAARETVVVEFDDAAGGHRVEFDVVDFHFPEDRESGCSVAGLTGFGPAGTLWALGLFALCAWRWPRSRVGLASQHD